MARKRRGRGEGSIYRENGRWKAIVTVGYDEHGRRKRRKVSGATKGEVQDKLSKLQGQKVNGTLAGEACKLTVAALGKKWLEDTVRTTLGRKTYAHYDWVTRSFINPYLGGVRLTNLTPAHVQNAYASMERDGHSARCRDHTHQVIRRALNVAVRWGLIPRNVCSAVDPPRSKPKEIQPLDHEQTQKLLKAAVGHRYHAMFVLAVTTGMRQGELFGLQWNDVDLNNGRIHVHRTLEEVGNQLRLKEPKTAAGKRNIQLPKMAVEALHEHRKRQVADGMAGSKLVFPSTEGEFLRKSNFIRRHWHPLREKAGIPPVRFHDLRHTHATLMLAQGVHPKVVQERLGHASIGITMDTYSHVLQSMQEEAAGKLDRMFGAETA